MNTYTIDFTNKDIRYAANDPDLTDEQCDEIADGLLWWFDEQFHDRINDLHDCIKKED